MCIQPCKCQLVYECHHQHNTDTTIHKPFKLTNCIQTQSNINDRIKWTYMLLFHNIHTVWIHNTHIHHLNSHFPPKPGLASFFLESHSARTGPYREHSFRTGGNSSHFPQHDRINSSLGYHLNLHHWATSLFGLVRGWAFWLSLNTNLNARRWSKSRPEISSAELLLKIVIKRYALLRKSSVDVQW